MTQPELLTDTAPLTGPFYAAIKAAAAGFAAMLTGTPARNCDAAEPAGNWSDEVETMQSVLATLKDVHAEAVTRRAATTVTNRRGSDAEACMSVA